MSLESVLPRSLQKTWVLTLLPYCILFVAHLGAAQIGYYVYQGISPAIIWPAAGVALAGLFVGGKELWPSITVASLVNSVLLGQPGTLAIGIALASTVQAYFAVFVLERFRFSPFMNTLRDISIFIVTTLALSALGPLIVSSVLTITGSISSDAFFATFGIWWLAAATSFLILGSFLIRWLSKPTFFRTQMQWVEASAAVISACVIAFIVSWTTFTSIFGISLIYVMLIPFFWLALRIGPRAMALAIVLIAAIMFTGASWGAVSPVTTLSERIISVEMFTLVWAIIFLFLVAVNEERKEALKAFSQHILELEDIIKKIRREEQLKTEFLAILAHELRNPLAPLLSSIEYLKLQRTGAGEEAQILTVMEERVSIMSRLLDDLLDISRITRNKLQLQSEVVNTGVIMERALVNTRALFESKKQNLTVTKPETPIYLNADPVRLEQIMVNLLTNASKYTDDGGTIAVRMELENDQFVFRVKDTGIGISQNMLRLIFEPFVQVSRKENRAAGTGLGIGLSLTKRLVELHDGSIVARSQGTGYGSEFIVTLPALPHHSDPEFESNAETADTRAGAAQSLERVLIVDDNEAAAEGLSKLLKFKGFDTTIEYDGNGALREASRYKPDVILLDIGLPDMTGYDVARTLRKTGTTAYLIALTGYGQAEDRLKAEEAGFDRHITKPVGIDDLEKAIVTGIRS